MTTAEVQTAIDNARQQLYTRLPDFPVVLTQPLNVQVYDQDRNEVIAHNVTSVHKVGLNIYFDNADHDDTNEEQEQSYEIQNLEEDASILDIYEACKQARPDLFEEVKPETNGFIKIGYGAGFTADRTPAEIAQAAHAAGLTKELFAEVVKKIGGYNAIQNALAEIGYHFIPRLSFIIKKKDVK